METGLYAAANFFPYASYKIVSKENWSQRELLMSIDLKKKRTLFQIFIVKRFLFRRGATNEFQTSRF